ncbi:MAG: M28 family peptidase, partial [Gemmatimonadota bacterium]
MHHGWMRATSILLPSCLGACLQGPPATRLAANQEVSALLQEISAERIASSLERLVGFGTRHTMSDTVSETRGIGAARRWIHAEMSRAGEACDDCLRVRFQEFDDTIARHPDAPVVRIVNVLAELPAREPTNRTVVVTGHYDSCICSLDRWDATSDAPGANDDASGTAVVLELARVVSRRYPQGLRANVLFGAVAGEEQGLYGSRHLARALRAEGAEIVAMITNDVTGNVTAETGAVDSMTLRVFAAPPDNGPARQLARYAWMASRTYQSNFRVDVIERLDRIGRGGDHRPFWAAGDPAVRFTEKLENYGRQHLPSDVLEHVAPGYVARVARANAATIVELASAPPPPAGLAMDRTDESGGLYWRLSWAAAPGAVGYEVTLRPTTSHAYTRAFAVGDTTEFLLRAQADDHWVG